eukprot:15446080-Alexandrium_andersonii.AAC.1
MRIAGDRHDTRMHRRGGAQAHRAAGAGSRRAPRARLRGAASPQGALVTGVSSAVPIAGIRRATHVHRRGGAQAHRALAAGTCRATRVRLRAVAHPAPTREHP